MSQSASRPPQSRRSGPSRGRQQDAWLDRDDTNRPAERSCRRLASLGRGERVVDARFTILPVLILNSFTLNAQRMNQRTGLTRTLLPSVLPAHMEEGC
eukprot:353867-Chlamydomonas_euryale.AAC.3